MKQRKHIINGIAGALILLWAYAALSKWSDFTTFGYQLNRQPLPHWSIPILKQSLPVVELLTAGLIYFKRTRLKGLIISSILMTVFTLYVLFALSGTFGEIPCSCAGIISAMHWKGHLVFNIVFTLLSFAGAYLQKHKDTHFVKHKPTAF